MTNGDTESLVTTESPRQWMRENAVGLAALSWLALLTPAQSALSHGKLHSIAAQAATSLAPADPAGFVSVSLDAPPYNLERSIRFALSEVAFGLSSVVPEWRFEEAMDVLAISDPSLQVRVRQCAELLKGTDLRRVLSTDAELSGVLSGGVSVAFPSSAHAATQSSIQIKLGVMCFVTQVGADLKETDAGEVTVTPWATVDCRIDLALSGSIGFRQDLTSLILPKVPIRGVTEKLERWFQVMEKQRRPGAAVRFLHNLSPLRDEEQLMKGLSWSPVRLGDTVPLGSCLRIQGDGVLEIELDPGKLAPSANALLNENREIRCPAWVIRKSSATNLVRLTLRSDSRIWFRVGGGLFLESAGDREVILGRVRSFSGSCELARTVPHELGGQQFADNMFLSVRSLTWQGLADRCGLDVQGGQDLDLTSSLHMGGLLGRDGSCVQTFAGSRNGTWSGWNHSTTGLYLVGPALTGGPKVASCSDVIVVIRSVGGTPVPRGNQEPETTPHPPGG